MAHSKVDQNSDATPSDNKEEAQRLLGDAARSATPPAASDPVARQQAQPATLNPVGRQQAQPAADPNNATPPAAPSEPGIVVTTLSTIGSPIKSFFNLALEPLKDAEKYFNTSRDEFRKLDDDALQVVMFGFWRAFRYTLALATLFLILPSLIYAYLPLSRSKSGGSFLTFFILGPLTLFATPYIAAGLGLLGMLGLPGQIAACILGIQFSFFTGGNIMAASGSPTMLSWFGQQAGACMSWLNNNPITTFFSWMSSWMPFGLGKDPWYIPIPILNLLPAMTLLKWPLASFASRFFGANSAAKQTLAGLVVMGLPLDRPTSYLVSDNLVSPTFWSYVYTALRTGLMYITLSKLNDMFNWIKVEPTPRKATPASNNDSGQAAVSTPGGTGKKQVAAESGERKASPLTLNASQRSMTAGLQGKADDQTSGYKAEPCCDETGEPIEGREFRIDQSNPNPRVKGYKPAYDPETGERYWMPVPGTTLSFATQVHNTPHVKSREEKLGRPPELVSQSPRGLSLLDTPAAQRQPAPTGDPQRLASGNPATDQPRPAVAHRSELPSLSGRPASSA